MFKNTKAQSFLIVSAYADNNSSSHTHILTLSAVNHFSLCFCHFVPEAVMNIEHQ